MLWPEWHQPTCSCLLRAPGPRQERSFNQHDHAFLNLASEAKLEHSNANQLITSWKHSRVMWDTTCSDAVVPASPLQPPNAHSASPFSQCSHTAAPDALWASSFHNNSFKKTFILTQRFVFSTVVSWLALYLHKQLLCGWINPPNVEVATRLTHKLSWNKTEERFMYLCNSVAPHGVSASPRLVLQCSVVSSNLCFSSILFHPVTN